MNHAHQERVALCDLFGQRGPEAPTLCGEWRTADLAAHLYLRERRPDAAVGIVLKALAGHTDRVQRRLSEQVGYAGLVAAIRRGPPAPLRLGPIDAQFNTVEYFVHHEDVRRGGGEVTARPLDPGLEAQLWSRLKIMGRLMLRRAPCPVRLEADGFGQLAARSGDGPAVTVTGAPGELVLFCFGRQAHSLATVAGPADAAAALSSASLGL